MIRKNQIKKITKILFVGNFLSVSKGTLGVTETLAQEKIISSISQLSGFSHSKYLRIVEILYSLLTTNANIIHVDVFSGRSFLISYFSVKIGKWRKKEVFGTLHGGRLHEYFNERKKFVKRILNEFDKLATPSLFLKQFFEKEGILLNHIPNSLNLKNFSVKNDYDFSNIKILWIRAFAKIYNPEIAVLTLKLLKDWGYNNAKLTMIGPDDGELKRIQSIIEDTGMQNSIDITGPIQNDLLFKYFSSHDIFLNTSSFESFGIANLEAAASGLLLVSHSVGEIPFLWENNKNAILIDSLDPKKFAEEIIRVFNNQPLFYAITTEGRKCTEKYDRAVIVKKWIDFLN